MKVAILLHGVWHRRPESVEVLIPWLEAMGYSVLHFEYGFWTLLNARLANDNLARALASVIRHVKPALIVSHSNGAVLEHRALEIASSADLPKINLLRIAPALDRDLPLPPCVNKCTVIYNARDWVVRLSARIPFAVYGSMGAFGPDSDDERFIRRSPSVFNGHSDYFKRPDEFRPIVESSIRRMEGTQ